MGDLATFTIGKKLPENIKVSTDWVDLVAEEAKRRVLRLHNTPSFIFQSMGQSTRDARRQVYSAIGAMIGTSLDYRRAIGAEVE